MLITLEELARGACIGVFGGAAGACTLAFPGSPLWLVPAAAAVGGCALTAPEVRAEVMRALPYVATGAQQARAALPRVAWHLPGVKRTERPQSRTEAPERAAAPTAAPQGPPPLMPALNGAQRVLVVGASDTGKTTLLRHMLDQRGGGLVLDPHASPGKWGRAKVVGAGRDYQAIAATLGQVVATMDRRYDEIARGVVAEGRHPKQTLVIDEWRSITRNVPRAGEQIAALLTEARKANIDLILAGHSANVKALNLEGEGDLRDGFQIVRLQKVGEERRATLDMGEGPQPYSLPGPYVEPQRQPATGATLSMRPANTAVSAAALADLEAMLSQPVSSASESVSQTAGVSVSVSGALVTDTDTGGVSSQTHTVVTPGEGGPTVRIDVHARAESAAPAPVVPGGRRKRPGGLNAQRRRQMAEARRADSHKAELQAAYAERKAAGLSYRKAYAELGGSSEDTRAWWHAAPEPTIKKG